MPPRSILLTVTVIVTLLAATGARPSAAAASSFSGRCSSIPGTTAFSPAVTGTARVVAFEFVGRGTCDVVLDGQQLSDTPVEVRVAGPIEASCSSARSTGTPVPGEATFTRGTADARDDVHVAFEFIDNVGVGTEFEGSIRGRSSGTGRVKGTFLTSRTSPDTGLRCARDGLSEVPTDLTVITDSPISSEERPSGDGGSVAPPDRAAPRIQLTRRCSTCGSAYVRLTVRVRDASAIRAIRVTLDGRLVRTTTRRRFALRLRRPRAGRRRHRVTVTATDEAGNRSRASVPVRCVRRSRPSPRNQAT